MKKRRYNTIRYPSASNTRGKYKHKHGKKRKFNFRFHWTIGLEIRFDKRDCYFRKGWMVGTREKDLLHPKSPRRSLFELDIHKKKAIIRGRMPGGRTS